MGVESSLYGGGGAGKAIQSSALGAAAGASPWGIAGMAGASMLQSIMEQSAAKKRQQREMKMKGAMARGEGEMKAAQTSGTGQQNALQNLMGAYRSALVR